MHPGKVPPDVLSRLVFPFLGHADPNVLLGPALGQDASLIRIGDRILIASTDPVTGSVEDIGWIAVNVNANDIATFGVQPRWFFVTLMMPPGSQPDDVGTIMQQIHEACSRLGITVAGGHTEVTVGLDRPIVVGFMLGACSEGEYVTSSGARPGDAIIMTKKIAIEGTAIIATEGADYFSGKIDQSLLEEAHALRDLVNVVKEGVTAFKTGHVTAMHDPTEGGLAGGLHEICDASGVGFRIFEDEIATHPATLAICQLLNIDKYYLISSGSMLITCDRDSADDIIRALDEVGVSASVIGEIVKDSRIREIVTAAGPRDLSRPTTDALWDALAIVIGQETA
ncbi:MAG: AIR synthase family protein [Candidatus Thorarchaeota archaeon]|nr:AIR synthase family protein [Candidatus Thorarchaeota archaeon]